MKYFLRSVICFAAATAFASSASAALPAWDARGTGPLPRQGISALDANDDLSTVVVGTISPAEEPNVILLDAEGRVTKSARRGVRNIDQALVGGNGAAWVLATITDNAAAGNVPHLYRLDRDPATHERIDVAPGYSAIHYGEHSNHLSIRAARTAKGVAVVNDGTLFWCEEGGAKQARIIPRLTTLAVAGDVAVVGAHVEDDPAEKSSPNLFVFREGAKKPLWSRSVPEKLVEPAQPPQAVMGTPMTNYGTPRDRTFVQNDRPSRAPLATAVAIDPIDPQMFRVAAADYRGWATYLRADDLQTERIDAVRYMPTRPTVSVYDTDGKAVQTFAAEKFAESFWCQLDFIQGGAALLVSPRSWNCRGLASQPRLPTDPQARAVYRLDVASGRVDRLEFPDAVAEVAVHDSGRFVVSCWNDRVYNCEPDVWTSSRLPEGIDVGGPAIVKLAADGGRMVVGVAQGVVAGYEFDGRSNWRVELDQALPAVIDARTARAASNELAPGFWSNPGQFESDLGSQFVIQAPDGYILIDPRAGHSFERQWRAMENAGLDPRRVKYVLVTHEHGDHAPGAALWRAVAGAEFITSPEIAYALNFRMPAGVGYGFNPPVKADRIVEQDELLDLAGFPISFVRTPGHTFGSLSYVFEKDGKRIACTGDLIMPGGSIGYAGSTNGSVRNILQSLRKLSGLGIDTVHGGHGGGPAAQFIDAGIRIGLATGWGGSQIEQPDPYYGLDRKIDRVVGWGRNAKAADFGDFDGDEWPDVALMIPPLPEQTGAKLVLYWNRDGRFEAEPNQTIELPELQSTSYLRSVELNGDRRADFFVADGKANRGWLVLSTESDAYRIQPLIGRSGSRVASFRLGLTKHLLAADLNADGHTDLTCAEGLGLVTTLLQDDAGEFRTATERTTLPTWCKYPRPAHLDVNGDGRNDLYYGGGVGFLRDAAGALPAEWNFRIPPVHSTEWTYGTTGDFNGDGRPDVAMIAGTKASLQLHLNTGDSAQPYADKPDSVLELKDKYEPTSVATIGRAGPTTVDWNGDRYADLLVNVGQGSYAVVLSGSADGLNLEHDEVVKLGCQIQFETRCDAMDFDGDGLRDLVCFGNTTGAGVGNTPTGPSGVFIRLRRANQE